ncbi:DUF2740 family protein [Escherichia coli]|nr:DUF2740 family protein [Escherichia coli]WRX89922.1 DUF2740 family protein [Escherichia coli]
MLFTSFSGSLVSRIPGAVHYLTGFVQPGRFRAEWEKVKKMFRGKGHE